MAFGQYHFKPVRKGSLLHGRKRNRLCFPLSRGMGAVQFWSSLQIFRIRHNIQHIVALAEPFDGCFFHRGWSSGAHSLEIALVTIRVVEKSLARSEQIALSAKAADSLHDAGVISKNLRLGHA